MKEVLPPSPDDTIRIPIIYEEVIRQGTPFECRLKFADGTLKEMTFKHNWFFRSWKRWTHSQ
jgi:hypothetical protein